VTDQFRLDTDTTKLDRQQRDCATLAVTRPYLTRIYFIDSNNAPGDAIPTLKLADLGAGGWALVPIAEGIQNLQMEYGVDTNNDGAADSAMGDPGSVANWSNVVSVKINLLARNSTVSSGYTDTKTYTLGPANPAVGPFNDGYKRHVFQSEVRLNNPAGRRE
jgi:type IV pilus assembly protein PilW